MSMLSTEDKSKAMEVDDGPRHRSCPDENEGDTALSWVFEGNREHLTGGIWEVQSLVSKGAAVLPWGGLRKYVPVLGWGVGGLSEPQTQALLYELQICRPALLGHNRKGPG